MQEIIYERGIKNVLRILLHGKEIVMEKSDFYKITEVQSVTRVPSLEYPQYLKTEDLITHFGLPIFDIRPKTKTILARILDNGFYSPSTKTEKLPLLGFENVWVATVEEVINHISYDDVPPRFFDNTVGEIRDKDQLKEVISKRYHKIFNEGGVDFKGVDPSILSQGVSIRVLRILYEFDQNLLQTPH